MAIERTNMKLAQALLAANAPMEMVEKALAFGYDDYRSESATPINDLVADARRHGLDEIARRAMNGEFDAQGWEAEEWANSPECKEIVDELGPAAAKALGLT